MSSHLCLAGGVHGDVRPSNVMVHRRPSPDTESEPKAETDEICPGGEVGIWDVRFIDFEVRVG